MKEETAFKEPIFIKCGEKYIRTDQIVAVVPYIDHLVVKGEGWYVALYGEEQKPLLDYLEFLQKGIEL
jgi:hypothetical protein